MNDSAHIAAMLAFAGLGALAGFAHLKLLAWNVRALVGDPENFKTNSTHQKILSSPRKRGPSSPIFPDKSLRWVPAFAGMTPVGVQDVANILIMAGVVTGRLAVTVIVFVVSALHGPMAPIAALAGFLIARTIIMRRPDYVLP